MFKNVELITAASVNLSQRNFIDSHGDAHAKDGFCNSIRKAEVQGEIINDRFKVTYFKLLKAEAKKE